MIHSTANRRKRAEHPQQDQIIPRAYAVLPWPKPMAASHTCQYQFSRSQEIHCSIAILVYRMNLVLVRPY
jgi:hypothetical protein